jgi:hypothetical protein
MLISSTVTGGIMGGICGLTNTNKRIFAGVITPNFFYKNGWHMDS